MFWRASVIIPTYNRAEYLCRCLDALAAQRTDLYSIEILVVDNNSTDGTRQVVAEFAQSHPRMTVRYLHEVRQGACNARNRAVAEALGEFVCFLDDDALATPEWLETLLAGFADPAVGCIGGPALPNYQGRERPPWLAGDLQGLLSGYKLPYTRPTPVSRVAEFPISCNMAVRRLIFDQVGAFRIDLDRIGKQVLAAGETEWIGRTQRAGWQIVYCPTAEVEHLMAPERLEKNYLYRIGRGLAASHVILTADKRLPMVLHCFASDGWYALRMLVLLCAALARGKRLWFDDYMRFWIVALRLPLRVRFLVSGSVA